MTHVMTVEQQAMVLKGTIELFDGDETKWVKAAYAFDAGGESPSYPDDPATCWCMLGGLSRAAWTTGYVPILTGDDGPLDRYALGYEDWHDYLEGLDRLIANVIRKHYWARLHPDYPKADGAAIARFNDHDDTTFADMTWVLRTAMKQLSGPESETP